MKLNDLPFIMIRALLVTIFVELIVSLIIGIRNKKDLINIVLVNIMTNPLVVSIPVYFNIKYGLIYRHVVLFILEILAVLSEGYIYSKYLNFKKINPYILSLILNISSYLIGCIINYL